MAIVSRVTVTTIAGAIVVARSVDPDCAKSKSTLPARATAKMLKFVATAATIERAATGARLPLDVVTGGCVVVVMIPPCG